LIPAEIDKISSEIIFVTTPDSAIRSIAEILADKLKQKAVIFHASGALSSTILESLRQKGHSTASLHPLAAISDSISGVERFKNAFFCIEGDAAAREIAEKIVVDLEGNSFTVLTEYKALYHAAAVMASGHLVALLSVAVETLSKCGLDEAEAQEILFPLVRTTVENLSMQTPAQALTGTFARADSETLKLHLENLSANVSQSSLDIYLQLGMRSLLLAQMQGADPENLAEMRRLLTEI
jgi:predicted short-subunit dehydrogenase-like oxidoreductase (DUF2520 family)